MARKLHRELRESEIVVEFADDQGKVLSVHIRPFVGRTVWDAIDILNGRIEPGRLVDRLAKHHTFWAPCWVNGELVDVHSTRVLVKGDVLKVDP